MASAARAVTADCILAVGAMLNALRPARRFYTTRMPVGATPQILISAAGTHKGSASIVTKITSLIVDHGASIAATKKIVMHNQSNPNPSPSPSPSPSPEP